MKANFIGKSKEYHSKIKRASCPIKHFNNVASWPISLDTPNIHLACYYGDKNYSFPSPNVFHNGLDIQVAEGTPVITPSAGKVIKHWFDPIRMLFDVSILSKSGITYEFLHLNTFDSRLPSNTPGIDYNSNFIVRAGDVIGKVGKWPYDLEEHINIPEDVEEVYGRKFNHLHFGTSYNSKHFNPIGLLVKI